MSLSIRPNPMILSLQQQFRSLKDELIDFYQHGKLNEAGKREKKRREDEMQFIQLINLIIQEELLELAHLKALQDKQYDDAKALERLGRQDDSVPLIQAKPKVEDQITAHASLIAQLEAFIRMLDQNIFNTEQFIQEVSTLLNGISMQRQDIVHSIVHPLFQRMQGAFRAQQPEYHAVYAHPARGPVFLHGHCADTIANLLHPNAGNVTARIERGEIRDESNLMAEIRNQSHKVLTAPQNSVQIGARPEKFDRLEEEEQTGIMMTIVESVRTCPAYTVLRTAMQTINHLDTLQKIAEPWKQAAEDRLTQLRQDREEARGEVRRDVPRLEFNPSARMKRADEEEALNNQVLEQGKKRLAQIEILAKELKHQVELNFRGDNENANSLGESLSLSSFLANQWPPKPIPPHGS